MLFNLKSQRQKGYIMVELVREILVSPAGSFGFVFGILVLAFWLVYFITKKITIINAKHDDLVEKEKDLEERTLKALEKSEEKVDKRCSLLETNGEKLESRTLSALKAFEEGIQKKFDAIEDSTQRRFEQVESKIDDIRKDISYLRGFTESIQKTVTDGYTQRHSPVSLTEKGRAEVKESGLDKMVERNWPKICQTLDKETKSKNPYDIQSYCMENVFVSPEKFFTDEDVFYIKELAFKKGLALMTYTNMLAVLIRDKYFIQKGIDVKDVDKYDPYMPANK